MSFRVGSGPNTSSWTNGAGRKPCTIGEDSLSLRRSRLVLYPRIAVRLHVHVDEVGRAGGRLEEVPALHPVVSALHFVGGDRRRVDQIEAALAQIVDGELIDLRIEFAIVVDEVVQIRALVRVDAPNRLADRAIERGISLGVNSIGRDFRTVMEGRDNDTTAHFLRQRNVWLG